MRNWKYRKVNTIESISIELEKIKNLHLVKTLQIEVLRKEVLKGKLFISENLFIQVYRNDRFKTTNFALVLNKKRIYARDELKGQWHRHSLGNPSLHDESEEGQKECNLQYFWKEAIKILRDKSIL